MDTGLAMIPEQMIVSRSGIMLGLSLIGVRTIGILTNPLPEAVFIYLK